MRRKAGALAVAATLAAAFPARAGTLPLTPLATVAVDSASAEPVTVGGLTPGLTYVLEASGTYRWGCEPQMPDCTHTFFADAECSEFGAADSAWRRYRFGVGYAPDSSWGIAPNSHTSDPLDLKVDSFEVEWMPGAPVDSSPGLAACTDGALGLAGGQHTYYVAYVATVPEIRLSVEDPISGDNAGALTVSIYEPFSG